nr:MAG TPA: hypothetical protein [Caudoviricetes sp.]
MDNIVSKRFLAYFNPVLHGTHFTMFCAQFHFTSPITQPRFTEDLLFLSANNLHCLSLKR